MTILPPFRRRIVYDFLKVIALFGASGVVLMWGLYVVGNSPSNMMLRNYDSIASAIEMRQAWHALHSDRSGNSQKENWKTVFDRAHRKALKNITEIGEEDILQNITRNWENFEKIETWKRQSSLTTESFNNLDLSLDELIAINQDAMFRISQRSNHVSQNALLGALGLFFISAFSVIFACDRIASQVSHPLKQIVGVLQKRPALGTQLKLPKPTSLELKFLSTELHHMWNRLSELDRMSLDQLAKEKKDLEAVLSSVEDAILVVDSNDIATHANTYFQRMLGMQSHDILHQKWTDLATSSENYLRLRQTMENSLDKGNTTNNDVEIEIDGIRFEFSLRDRRVLDDSNKVLGHVFLFRNITERKNREKLRRELIDWLSHELKTPLQSLGMAIELIRASKTTFYDTVQYLIATMNEDVMRIRGVADEFTVFTQSGNEDLTLHRTDTDLIAMLENIIKPFSVIAGDKNITLQTFFPTIEIQLMIDSTKFAWVVSNLMSNAIRVSNPGTKVEIHLADNPNQIVFEVRDDGPGVSKIAQDHLFEPFFQASIGEARPGLFGIGLAISKSVVIAHGGSIEYVPRLPRGTIFRVTLPKMEPLNGNT